MVPKVNNPQGVSTPDYLWRGERWDLKTIEPNAGQNTMFNRVKKAKQQAQKIVVDVTKSDLNDNTINAQIEKIFRHPETQWVKGIVLISNSTTVKVLEKE